MDCSMCQAEIPQARLDVAPHVKTCSAECAAQREIWRRRQGAKRARERLKAQRAAARAAR